MGKLVRANDYVNQHRLPREDRPVFHVAPPVGWMNDPNGFSFFGEKIHLFYQFHPYSDTWGPMHWGHCTTTDFVMWEELPVALAPDKPYDSAGCFSGSALSYRGQQALVYTGSSKRIMEDGSRMLVQQQCLAMGDGFTYTKYDLNPIISAAMLPEGYDPADFRDPKAWEEGGRYYLVATAMNPRRHGSVLLYESVDLKEWTLLSVLAQNNGEYGDMWECPDFLPLEGRYVLLASPMHIQGVEEFPEGFSTMAAIGTLDRDDWTFTGVVPPRPLDYGCDFYAPQTMLMPDGRRVMIAWMQRWENYIKPPEQKWHGMMTFPREMFLRDDCIFQAPVRELEEYRTAGVHYEDMHLEGQQTVTGVNGRVLDLILDLDGTDLQEFNLHFAKAGENRVTLQWLPQTSRLILDRSRARGDVPADDAFAVQNIPVRRKERNIHLRLLLDTCSVEVFVNGGEQTFTSTFYAPADQTDILFECRGAAIATIEKYDISLPDASNG